jgi:6-phosphofructokinase
MGRHAGFLTAAAALARDPEGDPDDGPHLVCVPEVAFDLDKFVDKVADTYDRLGRCQIAVSEGIQDRDGQSIGAMLIQGESRRARQRPALGLGRPGRPARQQSSRSASSPRAARRPRVRADTLGYLQRCWPDASPVDADEARRAGKYAAKIALDRATRTGPSRS